MLVEGAVLVADHRRNDEWADVGQGHPDLRSGAGADLEDRLVRLNHPVTKGLLKLLDTDPARRLLELTQIAHSNRKLRCFELTRIKRDSPEGAPVARPFETDERSEQVVGNGSEHVVAASGRHLRGQVHAVVVRSMLQLPLDQHLRASEADLSAFHGETPFLGIPDSLSRDLEIDLLDRLRRNAFRGQSELAKLEPSFDVHAVRGLCNQVQLRIERAGLGIVERKVREEGRHERERNFPKRHASLGARFSRHDRKIDSKHPLASGLSTQRHPVTTTLVALQSQREIA